MLRIALRVALCVLCRALLGLLLFLSVAGMLWREHVDGAASGAVNATIMGSVLVGLLVYLERLTATKSSKSPLSHLPIANVSTLNEIVDSEEEGEGLLPQGVTQQVTRYVTKEGCDALEGTFCVRFPASARQVTLHVPFYPAFQGVPDVTVYSLDDGAAKLQCSAIYAHGVAIDVRRGSLNQDVLYVAVTASAAEVQNGL